MPKKIYGLVNHRSGSGRNVFAEQLASFNGEAQVIITGASGSVSALRGGPSDIPVAGEGGVITQITQGDDTGCGRALFGCDSDGCELARCSPKIGCLEVRRIGACLDERTRRHAGHVGTRADQIGQGAGGGRVLGEILISCGGNLTRVVEDGFLGGGIAHFLEGWDCEGGEEADNDNHDHDFD